MRGLTRRQCLGLAVAGAGVCAGHWATSATLAARRRDGGRAGVVARGPDRCFRQFNLDWSWIALRPAQIGEFLSQSNPRAIADFLQESGVDGTVVMAVPHHGYCTHMTRVGQRFPALQFDWFGEMVEELHQRDIAAFGYVTLNWNWKFAREHLGADYIHGRPDAEGVCGFNVMICLNAPGFLDLVEAYSREVLTQYPVDGMRWDVLKTARGCRCAGCRSLYRELRGCELEPDRPLADWADDLYDATIERAVRRLAKRCRAIRPEVPIWHNHLSLYFPNPLDVVRDLDIAYNEYGDSARLLLLAGLSGHRAVINGLMNQTPTQPPQPPDRRQWLMTLALGGRCYSYYGHKHTDHRSLLPDDSLREWHRCHLAPLYREVSSLQSWYDEANPIADVPMLFTDRIRWRYRGRTREPWLKATTPIVEEWLRRSAVCTGLHVLDFDHPERGLDHWKLVLAVELSGLSPSELERLRRWVRAGGILISVGDSFRHDPTGHPLPDFVLGTELGLTYSGNATLKSIEVIATSNVRGLPGSLTVTGACPVVRAHAGQTLAVVRGEKGEAPVWHERREGQGCWVFIASAQPPDLLWHAVRWYAGPPPVTVAEPAEGLTAILARQPSQQRWLLHLFGNGDALILLNRRRVPAEHAEPAHPREALKVACQLSENDARLWVSGGGDYRIVTLI